MKQFSIALVMAGAMLWISILMPAVAGAQGAKRGITRIAGEVYRFQNNFHYSVFAVTPKGVIATDPINAEAARWLKVSFSMKMIL